MPVESETRTATLVETSSVAFAMANEALAVTKPDGTVLVPAPIVTDNPGEFTSATTHTLTAPVFYEKHGVYKLLWSFNKDTDANTYVRPQFEFTSTIDIWKLTNSLLFGTDSNGKPLKSVSEDVLNMYYIELTAYLQSVYAECIPDYALLTLPDAMYFDMALAALTAARYYSFHPNEFSTGAKRRVTQGPVTYEYATTVGASAVNTPDAWLNAAYNNLSLIACVAAALQVFNDSITLFDTAGPRRDIQERGPRYGINQLYPVAREEQLCWTYSPMLW